MSYIAYFDLLGTRGFCKDPDIYFENICKFTDTITEMSHYLFRYGSVGIFSDSAYAASSDLKSLLTFLIETRDRLMSLSLYFNAVVKAGDLSIKDVEGYKNVFGVSFRDSSIANLYILQTNFKGIGIFVDPTLKAEVEDAFLSKKEYTLNRCTYMMRESKDGKDRYFPIQYWDISLTHPRYETFENDFLDNLLRDFYSSYVKSEKFGAYYISLFSNLLRSRLSGFKWNMAKENFDEIPMAFRAVWHMISLEELKDMCGLDILAFVFLDEIFNSDVLTEDEKANITRKALSFPALKKYIHNLDAIPDKVMSENSLTNINNRDQFVRFCQEDLSEQFAKKILN